MKAQIRRAALLIAIAALTITGATAGNNSDMFASDQDPELNIERWMTSDHVWTNSAYHMNSDKHQMHFTNKFKSGMAQEKEAFAMRIHFIKELAMMFRTEQESELNIENWMTDDETWTASVQDNESQALFTPEQESDLAIENWMTNDYVWNSRFADIQMDTDSDLAIKSWMTDETSWK